MTNWLNRCHFGDVREVLRRMIADGVKVNTIITSPPYWGLRDYGHPGQIGLEPTLREFLDNLVEVFDLAREVLADDGTCWVNMGDSYVGSRGNAYGPSSKSTKARSMVASRRRDGEPIPRSDVRVNGLKEKDLVGQPWRLAFALQDAGWWLRQDIIWNKPNPMPESAGDRCTKAHEYLFLLTKAKRYYFDQDAIKEPVSESTHARMAQDVANQAGSLRANGGSDRAMKAGGRSRGVGFGHGTDAETRLRGRVVAKPSGWAEGAGRRHDELIGRYPSTPKASEAPGSRSKNNASMDAALAVMPTSRNKRSVWTIATESYKGAHFATYPQKLVEPCILAGSRPGDTVLDIFFGSGTTGQVAQRLGRNWIGIEVNPANDPLQRERIGAQPSLLLEAYS